MAALPELKGGFLIMGHTVGVTADKLRLSFADRAVPGWL
jgi:hypothetical protein